MRAVILVTTTPGGGPAVVQATEGDGRFTRRLATLGPFEAVFEVEAGDHDDLLDVIAVVNDVEAQQASETLLDMAVEEEADAPPPAYGTGGLEALVLLDESKARGCHYAHTLFEAAIKAHEAVEACYPLLGRFDDAAWLRAEDLATLTDAVRALQGLEGVRASTVLVPARDAS